MQGRHPVLGLFPEVLVLDARGFQNSAERVVSPWAFIRIGRAFYKMGACSPLLQGFQLMVCNLASYHRTDIGYNSKINRPCYDLRLENAIVCDYIAY